MRAVVQDAYGGPDVLRVAELERPEPGPDEVLIRVRAAGLDRGVWHLMTGLPYLVRGMGYGLRRPRNPVPGMDLAGTVEAIGADVDGVRPGDDVFGLADGSFAEYVVTRPERIEVKPDPLSFEQAAAVPVSGLTALQAVRDEARVEAGQSVLVLGAGGGVGSFAVQLARAAGARVTGVASGAKADLVRALGADDVVDYTREDVTDGRRTWDVILDLAGNRPLRRLRRALAPRGTLVIIGGEAGGRWFGGMERSLAATLLSPLVRQTLRAQFPRKLEGGLRVLREHVEAGRVRPAVEAIYPFERAADALRDLVAGRIRGKAVLVPGPTGPAGAAGCPDRPPVRR
jgi:NADPH:quinone reductase-like Zn-dependent oxidoreductase